KAAVDKSTVALDDIVTCTITLAGDGLNSAPEASMPAFDNLTLVSRSNASNISIVNGRASASFSYYLGLRPGQPGPATIGPSTITVGGTTYKTAPIGITVTKASGWPRPAAPPPSAGSIWEDFDRFFTRPMFPSGGAARSGGEPILTDLKVSKSAAYVNEMVILTFTFYRRVNLYQAPTYIPPETTGFWSVNLPTSGQLREVEVKGARYLAQDFKTALFASSAGKMTIGAAKLTAQADPFAAPVTIKTKPLTLDILPLPESGKPADFSGAVGSFSLSAAVDRRSVERGRPFTVSARITGDGNIQTVSEPSLEIGAGFRQLSTTAKEDIIKGVSSVSGSKTFQFILMPIREGEWPVGPLVFSYFDPRLKQYKTISSGPWPVKVLASNIPLPKEVTDDLRRGQPGAVKINFNWRAAAKKVWLVLLSPYILIALSVIVIAASGWFALRQYHRFELADPLAARRRKAVALARHRLKKANAALKGDRLKEFVSEVYEAVAHYLGDKFGFAAVGLTTDQLKETLAQKGLPAAGQQELDNFISDCDLIRFTPSKLDRAKAAEVLEQAETLIVTLEALPPSPNK
ncbi:MAG TPA: BatD family protein, partial [Candidatus Sulfotelmatobacter sp.]|nr:BatD family protein [Candidatus Sulfotelmatobacter sp.]